MKTIALQDLDEQVRAFVVGLHEGEIVNIVDGSRPIARLERPNVGVHTPQMSDEERQRRHLAFVALLRKQPALHLGRFNRDEVYEQD